MAADICTDFSGSTTALQHEGTPGTSMFSEPAAGTSEHRISLKSRPASQLLDAPDSPADSGSEYSQADSRPTSLQRKISMGSARLSPVPNGEGFGQGSELVQEHGRLRQDFRRPQIPEVKSNSGENIDMALSVPSEDSTRPQSSHFAPPASPNDSGSEFSQPLSPRKSTTCFKQQIVKNVMASAELPALEVKKSRPTSTRAPESLPTAKTEAVVEPEPKEASEIPSHRTSAVSSRGVVHGDTQQASAGAASPGLHTDEASQSQREPSQTSVYERPPSLIDSNPWTAQEQDTPMLSQSPYLLSLNGSSHSTFSAQSPRSNRHSNVPLSPITPHEAHMSMDSLQSIALSESSLDYDHLSEDQNNKTLDTPRVTGPRHLRRPSSLDILRNAWVPQRQSTLFDIARDEPLTPASAQEEKEHSFSAASIPGQPDAPSVHVVDTAWAAEGRRSSVSSDEDVEVNWHALDLTEEQEKEDKDIPAGTEDESTAFLLARLEQENAKFSADPKSTAGVAMNKSLSRLRSKSRPPSMAQLKKLVLKDNRYSLTPEMQEALPDEPPPMTELEFWTALVQDYPSTASRLPTLTTTKIRTGIPPPLRGVVWTSMSGARDKNLEDAYERLLNEKSPYEGIINKDVGRSFPGVELFRDAEGEGQKMLGRVLKCFSLHDKDIGYCQGLGFLVGPLLMNMGERDAFCVLVRLMDHYALRASFLPSLSGLHMRIFQFSTLLNQHHPALSAHLTGLGVEPAYLSQWFLSCFAVTCPLPMLFRIYDVIFAEGANETVMRVALALFRRNEKTLIESQEFEEVMQLLLGRQIWDVYGCSADELVDDFTSLGSIITHQRLAELEREFEAKDSETVGHSAGFLPDVQAAAGRFLGRLWAPTHGHTPSKSTSTTLSPQSAEKESVPSLLNRPGAFLRRSPSKQSISILNEGSSEGSASSGSTSLASTAPTDMDPHDSIADGASMKSNAGSMRTVSVTQHATPSAREQQELHAQIEDLLMALTELQREHAQMVAMVQREREERNDDHRVVRELVGRLRKQDQETKQDRRRTMPVPIKLARADYSQDVSEIKNKRSTLPPRPRPQPETSKDEGRKAAKGLETDETVVQLLEQVQSRLDTNERFSASFETKAQLRAVLARTREQLSAAETQAKELTARVEAAESSLPTFQQENDSLRAEVDELRVRVNDEFKERQRLELAVQNMESQMRMEARSLERKQRSARMERTESSGAISTLSSSDSSSKDRRSSIPGGGLRELRLGRRDSVGSVQSIRSMKSQRQVPDAEQDVPTLGSPMEASPPVSATSDAPAPALPSPSLPPRTHSRNPSAVPVPLTPKAPSHSAANSLSVPVAGSTAGVGFTPRTSSLATRAVLATPAHEMVPDEALLLELVNAKTSEAQARQEVDELKRSLQIHQRRAAEERRKAEDSLAQAQAEALTARSEAESAKEEARMAREEVFDASPLPTPMTPGVNYPLARVTQEGSASSPSGAGVEDGGSREGTPTEKAKTPDAATPGSAVAGWFWSRRTASTNKAAIP